MADPSPRFIFWWRWLVAVSLGVMLFGAVLVLAPALSRQLFGLLLYGSTSGLDNFGKDALAYVSLTHGVLGAVMFGWGMTLVFVLLGPFRRGSAQAWRTLVASLLAWFVPDTVVSLSTGFWQNAALNTVFALLFAPALVATRRGVDERHD